MKKDEQLERTFRDDLAKLLRLHNAELGLVSRGSSYMEYDVIQVTIDPTYDEGHDILTPYVKFDL